MRTEWLRAVPLALVFVSHHGPPLRAQMKEGAHGPLPASPFVKVIGYFAGEAKLRRPGPAP